MILFEDWSAAFRARPATAFTEAEALLFCDGCEDLHDWRLGTRIVTRMVGNPRRSDEELPLRCVVYYCTRCLLEMARPDEGEHARLSGS